MIVTQLWLVLSRQLRLAELADDRAGARRVLDAFWPRCSRSTRRPARRPLLVRVVGASPSPPLVVVLELPAGAQPALPPPGDERAPSTRCHLVNTYGAFGSVSRSPATRW